MMLTGRDIVRKIEENGYLDHPILLAKDSDGSDYTSLDDISIELVEADYDGGPIEDLFNKEELLDEDPDLTDATVKMNFKEALVLWPI